MTGMGWAFGENEWEEVANDNQYGASWNSSEQMDGWSTGSSTKDADMGELETTNRRQGGVDSLGDIIEWSTGFDYVK